MPHVTFHLFYCFLHLHPKSMLGVLPLVLYSIRSGWKGQPEYLLLGYVPSGSDSTIVGGMSKRTNKVCDVYDEK